MITNINKKLGIEYKMNEGLLNLMVTIFSLMSAFSRLGIGIIFDYLSSKLIITMITFMNVLIFSEFLSLFSLLQYIL